MSAKELVLCQIVPWRMPTQLGSLYPPLHVVFLSFHWLNLKTLWARSYMFSVHDPDKMISEQVLGTRAFRLQALWNVLGTPSFRFKIGTPSRSAQYDLLCIHCATCEVILTCTLHADSGLRAKPCPLRTCSRFHIVQTSFRRRTKGAICSENMLWQCSSWNCSSGNTTI